MVPCRTSVSWTSRLSLSAVCVAVAFAVSACAVTGGGTTSAPSAGTVTLRAEEGVNFTTGAHQKPGNFKNSDLFATNGGSAGLKLAPGGPDATSPELCTFFIGAGGKPTSYDNLAAVPDTLPTAATSQPALPHATAKNGFVVKNHTGSGYTKGWVSAASASEVTIEWVRLP